MATCVVHSLCMCSIVHVSVFMCSTTVCLLWFCIVVFISACSPALHNKHIVHTCTRDADAADTVLRGTTHCADAEGPAPEPSAGNASAACWEGREEGAGGRGGPGATARAPLLSCSVPAWRLDIPTRHTNSTYRLDIPTRHTNSTYQLDIPTRHTIKRLVYFLLHKVYLTQCCNLYHKRVTTAQMIKHHQH